MNWTWKEHFSLSINDERPSIVCDFSSFSMATTFHHYYRHKPPIQSPPPPTHLKPNQVLFLSSFTFTVSLSSLSLSLARIVFLRSCNVKETWGNKLFILGVGEHCADRYMWLGYDIGVKCAFLLDLRCQCYSVLPRKIW